MIEINAELAKQYFDFKYSRDERYTLACKYSKDIEKLISYKYVDELLGKYHPSEDEFIRQHRKKNFRLITETYFEKVLGAIGKIGKSAQFRISYPEMPATVREEETLYSYCELNYPDYDSVQNWFFTYGLRALLIEPNGVVAVYPDTLVSENQYYKPTMHVHRASEVYHFSADLCVLCHKEGLLIFNVNEIWYFTKDKDGKIKGELIFSHNFGYIPCIKLGGFVSGVEYEFIYKSFISGVVPFWTEALLLNSDLQAANKQHLFPEKHIYLQDECNQCQGKGKIYDLDGKDSRCGTCDGTGHLSAKTAYNEVIVHSPLIGEENINIPFPAATYVQKPIEPVRFTSEQVDKNISRGLAAVNMEFLMEAPLNQSGTAKEYDRSELNSYLYTIARHSVENILKPCYWYISLWRYFEVFNGNLDAIQSIQPTIIVPKHFDILGLSVIEGEIKAAREMGASAEVIRGLLVQYTEKRFENEQITKEITTLALKLNPFFDKTVEELSILKMEGMITPVDYTVSVNIKPFIMRAMAENQDFSALPYMQQNNILRKYAEELIKNTNKPVVGVPVMEDDDEDID